MRTAAKIPTEVTDVGLKQIPAITESRYYELRTDTSFVQSGRHNFIVLALVITDSDRNFLTLYWKNKTRFVMINNLVQYLTVGNHEDLYDRFFGTLQRRLSVLFG